MVGGRVCGRMHMRRVWTNAYEGAVSKASTVLPCQNKGNSAHPLHPRTYCKCIRLTCRFFGSPQTFLCLREVILVYLLASKLGCKNDGASESFEAQIT